MSDPKDRYSFMLGRWSAACRARDAIEQFIKTDDHENANKALNELLRLVDASRNDMKLLVDEIHELQRRLEHCISPVT
jgi:hypothetical protein